MYYNEKERTERKINIAFKENNEIISILVKSIENLKKKNLNSEF